MNKYIIAILTGTVCLLCTYSLTREGSILLSVALVMGVGGATGWMIKRHEEVTKRTKTGLLVMAFVTGTFLSEAIAFGWYYLTDGYDDPKLAVGIAVSVWEFATISVLGSVALLFATQIKERITRRFRSDTKEAARR